jgi:hypothetical protein
MGRYSSQDGFVISPLAHPIKQIMDEYLRIDFLDEKEKPELYSINLLREETLKLHLYYLACNSGMGQLDPGELHAAFKEVFKEFEVGQRNYVISPRKAYQLFGTEFGREIIHKDIWTRVSPTMNVIITDIRFPNEAEWVKENGGVLIEITRGDKEEVSPHSSEGQDLSEWIDVTVSNDGFMMDLRRSLRKYLSRLDS